MTDHAAIEARFVDYARVATRSAFKLIFEVPIENADKALAILGGTPVTGKEKWCALALLDPSKFTPTEQGPPSSTGLEHGASVPAVGGSNPPADTTTPAPKERRPFHTLPRSQQAALLCNDHGFRWWLSEKENRRVGLPPPGRPPYIETEQEAADAVRSMCGVASRRDLDQPDHALKWDRMVEEFSTASGRATWERPA